MRKAWPYLAIGVLTTVFCLSVVEGADRRKTYSPEARVMLSPSGALVTVEKRKVFFFDKDGKIVASRKLRSNELVSLPDGGSVVGLTRYNDHSPSTLKPVTFELFDLAGNRRYRIKKPGFSSVVVSPTGKAIVGLDGAEGLPKSVLRFCDDRGQEVVAITVEYYQGGRFSADGSVFVFSTAQEGILAYSSAGEVLAGYGPGSVYDLSADGGVFAVGYNGALRVYSGGKRVSTVETGEAVREVTVGAKGKHFGWVGPDRAALYAVGTDTALCEIWLTASGENFRSLAISEDGMHFAVGIDIDGGRALPREKRHTRGRVVVYDFGGQVIAQKEVSYDRWNARTPAVSFTHEGRVLSVITPEEAYFMELPGQRPAE